MNPLAVFCLFFVDPNMQKGRKITGFKGTIYLLKSARSLSLTFCMFGSCFRMIALAGAVNFVFFCGL